MAFRVEVTGPAERDIDEAIAFIAKSSVAAAMKWNDGLWKLVSSLKDNPTKFSIVAEAEELGHPYRSAVHFSHRVIFRIEEETETVYVVRVYHGARRPLESQDIQA